MSSSPGLKKSETKCVEMHRDVVIEHSTRKLLRGAISTVRQIVPPLWPLADYVAVNPWVGLTDRPFLAAHQAIRNVRDSSLLMPRNYFQSLFQQGRVTLQDLMTALAQCQKEYPNWYGQYELAELSEWLTDENRDHAPGEIRFRTVAEAVDERSGSAWSSHVINDITRHLSAHYDEGQAAWISPWKEETLYAAWRKAARLSRRMDQLGMTGFQSFVANLCSEPEKAVLDCLVALAVPKSHWTQFLLCQAFSVAGWASYVRYRVRQAEASGCLDDDLTGLLAIRLAYDVALAQAPGIPWPLPLWPADVDLDQGLAMAPAPSADALAGHALQIAVEQVYRRKLLRQLASTEPVIRASDRKNLQMVFCIDVRSEIFRRNLESMDESIETFGFAGFFGLPMEYVPFGSETGGAQCPVLLQPGFRVQERLLGMSHSEDDGIIGRRREIRQARTLWKGFQSSATSCFSFVESVGGWYLVKLVLDSLGWTQPAPSAKFDGVSPRLKSTLGPDIHSPQNRGLTSQRRLELAEGMLRNLGLTQGFARLVVLCGHAAEVTNNPYRAALDCGACGGHSGEPNARVAAALLNDPDVRAGLRSRGIEIPPDTFFLAALHCTTTDEIELCDTQFLPASHQNDLAQLQRWLKAASELSRIERSARLGARSEEDVLRRSRDWAEVRPEWGLAGNAAFIVAPRARTAGLPLDGRTFLHSYDHRHDPELKVLELIMTAPMVVTNWINLQYYASTVDPTAFGSGNKVIHNVVGQFGVLEGNGGDLKTGLPWQSVHDGTSLQHEPLRLLVVIDAPRASIEQIVQRHRLVHDLVTHGWVSLIAWEGENFYRWTAIENWEPQPI